MPPSTTTTTTTTTAATSISPPQRRPPSQRSQHMRLRTNQQRQLFDDDAVAAAVADTTIHKHHFSDYNDSSYSSNQKYKNDPDDQPLLMSLAGSRSGSDISEDGMIYARIPSPENSMHYATETLTTGPSSGGTTAAGSGTGTATGTGSSSKILIFGMDISHLSRKMQFVICAGGVFMFSLLYGYLQELISVKLFARELGLFLAMVQFMGYAIWSRFFNSYVENKHHAGRDLRKTEVPASYYILLAILRAIDASMTNMAMAYVNYPAKTLMKSSRVVFTMLFSTIVSRKRYQLMDYMVVLLMVSGLIIFMHADSNSSAIFQPIGIIMLTVSLCCDAVLTNLSERIMNQYNVGQDEFIYKLYSIALVGIVGAAAVRGDLLEGTRYILSPGTYSEVMEGAEPTWSVHQKIIAIILFSSTGFLGSSCSALITKEFGALTMSITSTARKATTLFLSFALFTDNVCTKEHIEGICLFIAALIGKSIRASRRSHGRICSADNHILKKEEEKMSPMGKYDKSGHTSLQDSYHRNGGVHKRRNRVGDLV